MIISDDEDEEEEEEDEDDQQSDNDQAAAPAAQPRGKKRKIEYELTFLQRFSHEKPNTRVVGQHINRSIFFL